MHQELIGRIQSKDAVVGVIGLGYVGLPLVLAFAERGFRVKGYDVDVAKVSALREGQSYIRHIASDRVQEMVESGRFEPIADFDRLPEADALLICVPTPLTESREPDLTYIRSTADELARTLRRGQLIILESTTYPGTTEEVLLPALEASALAVGTEFFLAYSPEREDPGNPRHSTTTIPKVVGGVTPACGAAAAALYGEVIAEVVPVSCTQVAELTKLLENIYRSVNIALVNELKVLCHRMGLDVHEVIGAAATKPFGFQAFYPGPGLGGHCIPIDPFYLTWKARQFDCSTRFIELAGEVNTSMPYYVVDRLAEALNESVKPIKGSTILVLGVAYKRDVDDMRESPALKIMELLAERGAVVSYHDPYVATLPSTRRYAFDLSSVPLEPATLKQTDAVIVVTDHQIVDYAEVVAHAPLVIDTRDATRGLEPGACRIVPA